MKNNILNKKNAIGFLHKVYLSFLKTNRNYLASTKTKSEIRGGGRKPWRQKGTGNARAGSIRSPLWRGGGVIFGPKPRQVFKKINKKENKLAILLALKLKENQTLFINKCEFDFENNKKTKNLNSFLKEKGFQKYEKILFIVPEITENLKLTSQNINNLKLVSNSCLNIKQILECTKILIIKN